MAFSHGYELLSQEHKLDHEFDVETAGGSGCLAE